MNIILFFNNLIIKFSDIVYFMPETFMMILVGISLLFLASLMRGQSLISMYIQKQLTGIKRLVIYEKT